MSELKSLSLDTLYVWKSTLKGGFGSLVLEVLHEDNKESYALKYRQLSQIPQSEKKKRTEFFENEAAIHQLVSGHENIVKFVDHVYMLDYRGWKTAAIITTELCEGSLDRLCPSVDRPDNFIKKLMYGVVTGLTHLHGLGIIHRNMQPRNILILNETAKICDFAHASPISPLRARTEVVNVNQAPELLLGADFYGPEVDLWGLGMILFELNVNEKLTSPTTLESTLSEIIHRIGPKLSLDIPELRYLPRFWQLAHTDSKRGQDLHIVDWRARDLTMSLLQCTPHLRPSAENVIEHYYFLRRKHANERVQDPALIHDHVKSYDHAMWESYMTWMENRNLVSL